MIQENETQNVILYEIEPDLDKNVIKYFSKIIESVSDCKIILYNFEKLAGYKFSLNCVEELKNRFPDQIVGIKDSTYNIYDKYKKNDLSILVGSEEKLLSGLKVGCSGAITVSYTHLRAHET